MQSHSGWWFGCHFLFSHILGISSSQLTFIFFRGVAQPPTRINCEICHFGDEEILICPDPNGGIRPDVAVDDGLEKETATIEKNPWPGWVTVNGLSFDVFSSITIYFQQTQINCDPFLLHHFFPIFATSHGWQGKSKPSRTYHSRLLFFCRIIPGLLEIVNPLTPFEYQYLFSL